MELNITAKWILGIMVTILLGAIGSGLWSLVLDPLLKRFGKFFMSISTFGLRSIQNNIYAKIAQGHRDHSVRILMLIIIFGITIPISTLYGIENSKKVFDEEMNEAIKIVKSQDIPEDEVEEKVSILIDKSRAEKQSKRLITIILMTSFFWCVFVFQYFKIAFVEWSISRFDRWLNVCLPYFSGKEKEIAKSKIALIKNKEDYYAAIENLEEIAARGNITLPS